MQPRLYYASSLLGGIAFSIVGVVTGSSWLILCGCVGPVLAIAFAYFGNRRIARPHGAAWNTKAGSRTLTPVSLPPLPPTGFRWTGGCNVPGGMGRVNATYPLSLLVAAPGWARIEMRPPIAQRFFGYQPRHIRAEHGHRRLPGQRPTPTGRRHWLPERSTATVLLLDIPATDNPVSACRMRIHRQVGRGPSKALVAARRKSHRHSRSATETPTELAAHQTSAHAAASPLGLALVQQRDVADRAALERRNSSRRSTARAS